MTTLREAAQQALEALEEATNYTSCSTWSPSMTEDCEAASAALRAALAEPVQEPKPVAWTHINGTSDTKRHQPQRKPLTDEEIVRLWYPSAVIAEPGKRRVAFGRAIERAHGIGGQP